MYILPDVIVDQESLHLQPWFWYTDDKYGTFHSKHFTNGTHRGTCVEKEAFYLHSCYTFISTQAPVLTETIGIPVKQCNVDGRSLKKFVLISIINKTYCCHVINGM